MIVRSRYERRLGLDPAPTCWWARSPGPSSAPAVRLRRGARSCRRSTRDDRPRAFVGAGRLGVWSHSQATAAIGHLRPDSGYVVTLTASAVGDLLVTLIQGADRWRKWGASATETDRLAARVTWEDAVLTAGRRTVNSPRTVDLNIGNFVGDVSPSPSHGTVPSRTRSAQRTR